MKKTIAPLVLNFDDSVLTLQNETRFDLRAHQESMRLGCTKTAFNRFNQRILMPKLEAELRACADSKMRPIVFMGSGDFHHFSLPLIEAQAQKTPFQLIILDNHPDNMRYLFGIHCGSWVSFAAKFPYISHIHVVGISSKDVAFSHLWENRLRPLYSGKITYWCQNIDTKWIKKIGLNRAYRSFNSSHELISTFLEQQAAQQDPIYLSIDKDVLSTKVVQTNWDQGDLSKADFFTLLNVLKSRLLAVDVTGEISVYHYKNRLKRLLSAIDDQPQFNQNDILDWQKKQTALNQAIIEVLS